MLRVYRVCQFALVCAILVTQVKGQGCEPYVKYPGHTMCIYKASDCSGNEILRQGFSPSEQQEILDAHNTLRMKTDDIIDLRNLTWNDEVALIAQRLADQCLFQHDQVRRIDQFEVGQNLFISSKFPVDENLEPDGYAATKAWFDEVTSPKFNPENIAPIIAYQTKCLGCGYTMYKDSLNWSHKLYVCNYGPTGDEISGTMWFGRGLSAMTSALKMGSISAATNSSSSSGGDDNNLD